MVRPWDPRRVVEVAAAVLRPREEWGASPPPPAEAARVRVLKAGPRSTVLWVDASGPEGEAVVLKVVPVEGALRRAWSALFGSPARVQQGAANLLLAEGIDTAVPLAVVDSADGLARGASVYLARALERAEPVQRVYRRLDAPGRRRLAAALGRFVARVHDRRIYIPDLKDENLLVEPDPELGWRFYVVDLDRVRRPPLGVSRRRQLGNFVDLERQIGRLATPRERAIVLAAYRRARTSGGAPGRGRLHALAVAIDAARRRKDYRVARRRRRSGLLPEPRLPVTCTIICFNEEHRIRACLESVSWCEQIVVVDSFSTDRTLEIAREYTDDIVQNPFVGHVEQKQFALDRARCPWVLNLDADESVSPELREEILEILAHDGAGADGFYIPRLVYYLGRWWRYGGWYPDKRLRLFRRERAVWGGANPHERVLLRGKTAQLRHPIWHFTYDGIADHVRTINRFTTTSSEDRFARGRRASAAALTLRPVVRFLRFWVWRGGFRMGFAGMFVALSAMVYTHLKYAKLDERERGDQGSTAAKRLDAPGRR